MAVSANDVWQQLTRIGVLDQSQCRDWTKRFQASRLRQASSTGESAQSESAEALAQFLIANAVTTKFQSQRLLAGRGSELRLGDYVVLDRCDQSPLSRWYRARHIGTQRECFIYPCTDELTSSRWVDLVWLKPHSKVEANALQPISLLTLSASDPWRGAICSAMPPGRPLEQWAAEQGKLDAKVTARIGRTLAAALATMHAANLIHGAVRPSRIWCGENRSLWLLRDAGRPPASPTETVAEHGWFDDDRQAKRYASPESAGAASAPTPSGDLFALAATMYELVTGDDWQQAGANYKLPAPLTAARDGGAVGDPLLRTLAYALAPTPESRFADVGSFGQTLAAVISAYESIEPTKQVSSPPPSPPKSEPAKSDAAKLEITPVVSRVEQKQIAAPEQEPTKPMRPARRRKRRTRRGPVIVGAVAAIVLLGICAILLLPDAEPERTQEGPPLPPPPPRVEPIVVPTTTEIANLSEPAGYELVADDRLLWAAPWPGSGDPASLELLPPGAQMIAVLRPGRFLTGSAGASWQQWFGAQWSDAIDSLESRSGIPLNEIDRLSIAFSTGAAGVPQTSFAVKLRGSEPISALTKSWDSSPSRTEHGKTLYTKDLPEGDAYFIPADADESAIDRFAFGPLELVKLIAENDGQPILLPRVLQQLWDSSHAEADLVAVAIPNFLFADGRAMLTQYAPAGVSPLRSLLIPNTSGVIVSMSFVDHWYGEARVIPSGSVSAPEMMRLLQERVSQLPTSAESFAIDAAVDPSWRALAIRLPQFMRALAEQTRFGVSQTVPTLNFYMPADAGPQVILASALALSSPTTSGQVAVVPEPTAMPIMGIEQQLDLPFSVSFDQESLEFAVAMIRDEFSRVIPAGSTPPTITIVGGDLEKSGITQNQQIRDFRMRDKPLREALCELVRQANPDKTVTELSQAKQTLVWAIDPASTPSAPAILITTRPAAATKGISLSREFITGN